jgi:hypothetical protein
MFSILLCINFKIIISIQNPGVRYVLLSKIRKTLRYKFLFEHLVKLLFNRQDASLAKLNSSYCLAKNTYICAFGNSASLLGGSASKRS